MIKIVKLYIGKKTEPKFYIFNRVDNVKKRFLVTYPIYKPDRFREAKWFDFDEVRVDWIKEFVDD